MIEVNSCVWLTESGYQDVFRVLTNTPPTTGHRHIEIDLWGMGMKEECFWCGVPASFSVSRVLEWSGEECLDAACRGCALGWVSGGVLIQADAARSLLAVGIIVS